MSIGVGDEAPDFELRDQTRQRVRLSDYRDHKAVVVVFYPWAFTRVCGSEMCAIRDDLEAFRNDDVETLAISVDSSAALRAWAEQEGFAFPLLSDFWPHGEVARAYGVFNEAVGVAERGTFILDRDGIVVYTDHNAIRDARDLGAWKAALERVGAG